MRLNVLVECMKCNEPQTLVMTEEQYREYHTPGSRHVQDIFPEMDRGLREMLISGICPGCWAKIFKKGRKS